MRNALFVLLALSAPLAAAKPALTAAQLAKLPPHPRLMLTERRLSELKAMLPGDKDLAWKLASLRKQAEEILAAEPSQRVLKGPRLLMVSREVLRRVSILGLLYRLEGDARYAARARKEMMAAAAFSDWNPSHFLDVGEMSHALALGYDWLLPELTPGERAAVRQALIEKGLKHILPLYAEKGWQVTSEFNWNQVCNGGVGIAALALGDEEPELAAKVLSQGIAFFPISLKSYGKDGAWAEGAAYWDYATRYTAYFLASLESALGTDFGLSKFEGLRKAGDFFMHAVGPGRRAFNFADAKDQPLGPSHAMLYLAARYRKPGYAAADAWGMKEEDVDAFDALWHIPGAKAEKKSLDAQFPGIGVAFFRSAFADDAALYVGFKGGDNRANHGHLDQGSFILDAAGLRWASDFGGDDYNLPGYWDKDEGGARWKYFRLNTASHNTLMVDGRNQKVDAWAPLVAFSSKPRKAFAVVDMSQGYAASATKARRGLAVLERSRVLVQDEIELKPEAKELRWAMLTRARITPDGARAVLSLEGKELEAKILEPAGAAFQVLPAAPPSKEENQNEGFSLLAFRVKGPGSHRLAVLLTPPGAGAGLPAPALKPLKAW